MAKTRDKIVQTVANWILSFGTEEYQQNLKFTYSLGMAELDRRKDANKTRAVLGMEDYEEPR